MIAAVNLRLPADELEALASLQERIGYAFAHPALLRAALTFGSWVHENPDAGWPENGTLEFFGDSVLGLVAAESLWNRFPALGEGDLTRLRAMLVSEASLAEAALAIDLGSWLYLGRGDVKRGARQQASTLADATEAVLAAVFLDAKASGAAPLERAAGVFERLFAGRLAEIRPGHPLDPKSELQQWAQGSRQRTPVYVRVGDRPSPASPGWRARVQLVGDDGTVEVLGEGEGASLRAAERAAAAAALARRSGSG